MSCPIFFFFDFCSYLSQDLPGASPKSIFQSHQEHLPGSSQDHLPGASPRSIFQDNLPGASPRASSRTISQEHLAPGRWAGARVGDGAGAAATGAGAAAGAAAAELLLLLLGLLLGL